MLEIVQQQLNLCLENEQTPVFVGLQWGSGQYGLTRFIAQSTFKFAVAHCNFQLRGEESDADEDIVKQQCAVLAIPFFSKRFSTRAYAEENRLSTKWPRENCVTLV